ncbi:MAG TPA: hypothetical protein VFX60_07980 [Micromonospora sp.]|nr:hypothetical protein [Micromonospora sp.]
MGRTDPGSVREEAERLVATALAAARSAASAGHAGQFATGDDTCCTCPLCRVIKVLREPNPEFAERAATGAGELAAGVATLLRSFSSAVSRTPGPRTAPEAGAAGPADASGARDSSGSSAEPAGRGAEPGKADAESKEAGDDDVPGQDAGAGIRPDAEQDVWAAATRAEAGHDEESGGGGERQR